MDKNKYHEINRYKDALFPVEVYRVSGETMRPPGRGLCDFHWHDELQFTLAVRGSLTLRAEGEKYYLKEGDAAFINSGIIHAVTELSPGGEYISLNFPYKLLNFFPGSRMEKECVLPYVTGGSLPTAALSCENEGHKDVLDILKEINCLMTGDLTSEKKYMTAVKITALWSSLISSFKNKDKALFVTNSVQRERLRLMLSFIYEHFPEDIDLSQTAEAAHISIGECCRIFKGTLGVSPHRFLTEYRIRKSAELLLEGLSVSEAAGRCGFNQVSNYISKFKKIMGCTPGCWRRQI